MNIARRLERLESAITNREQGDPVDLTLLSADELRDFEDLRAKACGDDGAWDLKKLADSELRTLKTLLKKASVSDGDECSQNTRY